jgi:quercetin dioxygenase-like cupin family protein
MSWRVRIRGAAVAATAAVVALAPSAATATPPVGLVAYSDLARTQATAEAMVSVPPGSSAYVGRYTLAPGAGISWRTLPGVAVLSVLSGTLRVVRPNCSWTKAATGLAAVLPAGTYLLGNRGTKPVEFVGVFVNLKHGALPPLQAPGPKRPPAKCPVSPAWNDDAGEGLLAAEVARGRFAGQGVRDAGTGQLRTGGGALRIKQGRDILVSTSYAAPGSSSGWISHYPALTFVGQGVAGYYEKVDEGCVKRGEFRRGDAYGRADGGTNMTVNEGSETLVLTSVYVNIPHRGAWLPVGNHLEAIDFAELPPLNCGRL